MRRGGMGADIQTLALRLGVAREPRGLTQNILGIRAEIAPTTLAHYESGARLPSYENLQRLTQALEVSADYLLGRSPALVGSGADIKIQQLMGAMAQEDRD